MIKTPLTTLILAIVLTTIAFLYLPPSPRPITQNLNFDISAPVPCGQLIEATRQPEKIALFPGMTINIHIVDHDRCPNIGAQVIYYPGRAYVDMVFREDQMLLSHILHETYHITDHYIEKFPENDTPEGRAYLYTNLFETVLRALTK